MRTLHVSDSFSNHHQESSTVHTAIGIGYTSFAVCAVLDSWWWTEELSETCRVLFEKWFWDIGASRWFYYKTISRCTVLWMSNSSFASPARRRPQFSPNTAYVTLVAESREWGKLFSGYRPLVSLSHYHTSFAPHSFLLPPPMQYNLSNWQCL